ncbi:uncharacterized protein ACA1_243170 [Acanthamoeba castellanii str. Neff]|uniref:Uncharacterized protein n=1 Tax=Acanthamoeba castellanii (strain ATCC 30010 / Neff) TaxID=1257118 RepID=L8GK24_ACACF|nr:uncharacterized protein ACA1_243170 [Acanthamoeba castellanii str. Neff]ELR13387.1 hypothetical protein ACA1_243170 [Acanthamoeba castellanii str. Neff]
MEALDNRKVERKYVKHWVDAGERSAATYLTGPTAEALVRASARLLQKKPSTTPSEDDIRADARSTLADALRLYAETAVLSDEEAIGGFQSALDLFPEDWTGEENEYSALIFVVPIAVHAGRLLRFGDLWTGWRVAKLAVDGISSQ